MQRGRALSADLKSPSVAIHATGGRAEPELAGLTPLRGIAAVTVLLYHSSFVAINFSSFVAFNFAGGAPPWLWRRGSLAVDLFFVPSGFVLTHVYGRRFGEERNWRTVNRFLWARFCRIYPASLSPVLCSYQRSPSGISPFPQAPPLRGSSLPHCFLCKCHGWTR
jgi:peptidoglycan/LPS O-acetylase OafA/YrhL